MSQNIIPKDCSYGCNTRIYWNTAENAYFEVFTQKRHLCPNRQQQSKPIVSTTTAATRPNYYNKFSKQPKPKMSNSIELLSGPISEVQKKYELLSDIVSEYNGKVHGSQSHVNDNNISLIVYYEILEGKREEVKQKFDQFVRNEVMYVSKK
jgi:hypothetical protein